jgi:hypothetical protein
LLDRDGDFLADTIVFMKKLLIYVLLGVLAVAVAGFYGIIHNQISYTVSPEYFTKFKFRQFGFVDMQLPERVRASVVGFLASWWMGIPIGLLVGAAGFIHKGYRRMFKVSLWSFAVVVVFTLLFGLCGLFYGYLQTTTINISEYRGWFIPRRCRQFAQIPLRRLHAQFFLPRRCVRDPGSLDFSRCCKAPFKGWNPDLN